MPKGEIARFEQFLLLSLCLKKVVCCRGVQISVYMRERVKCVYGVRALGIYKLSLYNMYLTSKPYVGSTQKNHLIETFPSSTHNMGFKLTLSTIQQICSRQL